MTNTSSSAALWFAELRYLRSEAMALLDRCLDEGQGEPLEAFVDDQIAHEPPRLDLLWEIADELARRQSALLQSHALARDRVAQTLVDDLGLTVSTDGPSNSVDAFLVFHAELYGELAESASRPPVDSALSRKLSAALADAQRTRRALAVVRQLHAYLLDWLGGLSAVAARQSWHAPLSGAGPSRQVH